MSKATSIPNVFIILVLEAERMGSYPKCIKQPIQERSGSYDEPDSGEATVAGGKC